MAQWWGSCGAAWVVWFITLADVQSSGWWGSCRPVVVSPRGSTGGGSGGSSLAGSGHPGPGRTDLTPEKRQVVESSEASSPLFPCLYSSPVLYIFSITHTHNAGWLTKEFSQFSCSLSSHLCPSPSLLLRLPPLSKQMSSPSLSNSSSSDGPIRWHCQNKNVYNNVHIIIIHQVKKWCLILHAVQILSRSMLESNPKIEEMLQLK